MTGNGAGSGAGNGAGGGILAGSVAAVIGGAGGIGSAIVAALASAGAKAAVVDLSLEAAERVAGAHGGRGFVADAGDEDAVRQVHADIESALGPVDILVNSAVVFQAPGPIGKVRMKRWDEVVRITHRATFLACATFGGAMAERGRGAIVNIASVGGMRSLPVHGYGPAKAAVIALTESLAAEWGHRGLRVNAISPGFTRTPAMQAAIDNGRDYAPILAGTPLGRLIEPEEVAQAVLFLVSPAASAITGVNLPVDAGWLIGTSWQAYGGLPTAPET